MGFDMWLSKQRKLPSDNEFSASQYLVEEVATWRKANAIHRFFEERIPGGIENCVEYVFSTDDIRELLRIVTEVLDNPQQATERLPRMSGFFFGSTEYDEWYRKDLEQTRDMLTQALEDVEPDDEFIYSAWW